jgi:signal transduction histidine kinase
MEGREESWLGSSVHTILLIDDDARTRQAFGLALRQKGYHLIEADSGIAGLEAAKKYLPDLILTDINMPGGDGRALLYHIRHTPEISSRQVVLMTGYIGVVSPRKGMEEGADDFLIKPFTMEELISCVEARLRRADIHWRVEDRNLEKLRASLLSTLPHELFTPLAGMMGLTEYLHSNATIISLDEMQKLHSDIYATGLRLHRTLTNYFRVLELEGKPMQLEGRTLLDSFDVHAAVQAGVNAVMARPGPPRTINLEISAVPVQMEGEDLKIIVEELVDNARKFSGIGTDISVSLNKEGTLTVINQGRGMSEEQIKRIGAFQQFERKKHEQEGLGLGLMLTQKLAERNGAKLVIESQPGQETAVSVIFRKVKQAPSAE